MPIPPIQWPDPPPRKDPATRFDAVPITNLESMRDELLQKIEDNEEATYFMRCEVDLMTAEINRRLAAHAGLGCP